MAEMSVILQTLIKSNTKLNDNMQGLHGELGKLHVILTKLDKTVEHQGMSYDKHEVRLSALELGLDTLEKQVHTLEHQEKERNKSKKFWADNWHKIFQTAIVVCAMVTALYTGYHKLIRDVEEAKEATKVQLEVTTDTGE